MRWYYWKIGPHFTTSGIHLQRLKTKLLEKFPFFAWKPNQKRFENMLKFVIDKFAITDRSKKSQFLTKLSSNYKLSMITK